MPTTPNPTTGASARRSAVDITDRSFIRSHGKAPRGHGAWGFAPSTSDRAFDADVDFSRMVFITAGFGDACAQARRHFAGTCDIVAVLP